MCGGVMSTTEPLYGVDSAGAQTKWQGKSGLRIVVQSAGTGALARPPLNRGATRQRGVERLRRMADDLFRFGARVYQKFQPQSLNDF